METLIDFSVKPTLEGKKVILRPFQEKDWEAMTDILSDPEVNKLTGSVQNDKEANTPIQSEEVEHFKKWYQSRNEQTNRLDLAIIDKETGELVGEVVFNEFDENTRNVNYRILIGPKGRNKGIGTEATTLFIEYGFQFLKLHKIDLEVYSFNPRAEYVYKKNGFVLEGILREKFKYNEEYIDTKIYGILKSDYDQQLFNGKDIC
jgi:RimJ/RimL family protein N-acetyltransferase